ncbi:hypothetical protein AHAS_Ahas03G0179200 [Arachis hypogaea]
MDLLTNSFLHLICIYVCAQGITYPLTQASLICTLLYLSFSYILVTHLCLRVVGVIVASVASNISIFLSFIERVWLSGLHYPTCSFKSLHLSMCFLLPLEFVISTWVENEFGTNRPFRAEPFIMVFVFFTVMMSFSLKELVPFKISSFRFFNF